MKVTRNSPPPPPQPPPTFTIELTEEEAITLQKVIASFYSHDILTTLNAKLCRALIYGE